jgi:hypothetical protein
MIPSNMPGKAKRSRRPARKTKRPIGLAKNKLKVTRSFFKPLPHELLAAFEGKS